MTATSSPAHDAVAIVLAGGRGTRLDPLTRRTCKPALPFGAAYRSIDFSLSNCVNSGIRRIGIPTQYRPDPLLRHIEGVWAGAATAPGEFVTAWTAEDRAPKRGYCGTADAVYRNLPLIEALDCRLALILAGDHVYQMDYRPLLQRHAESGAAVTVACTPVPVDGAHELGVLSTDGLGRIERFVEKPKDRAQVPVQSDGRALASMGVYVFDVDVLGRALRLDAFSSESRHDFGGDMLPRIIRAGEAFAFPFLSHGGAPAYWRDIGTIEAYWQAHMELLDASPPLRLDDPGWPLPAACPPIPPSRADPGPSGSLRERSLIARHCSVDGKVERSVLFERAEVHSGAEVTEAVVLPGAAIGRDCRLRGVIVDSGCRIPSGTVIDGYSRARPAGRARPIVVTAQDVGAASAAAVAASG